MKSVSVEADGDRKGRVLKKKKILNVGFVVLPKLLSSLRENFQLFRPCVAPLDY